MTNYAIIAENDVSQWKDQTGKSYHFPKRHLKILIPDCKIVYYKGKLNKSFLKLGYRPPIWNRKNRTINKNPETDLISDYEKI